MRNELTIKQIEQKKKVLTAIGQRIDKYMVNKANIDFMTRIIIQDGGVRDMKYQESGRLD